MHRGLASARPKMTISCPSASAARNTCPLPIATRRTPGGTAPGFPHLQFHQDGLRLNARQAATQTQHGGQPITVQRHVAPLSPRRRIRRPHARRPAVQPVSVEDDNAARRRGFGGHALQGGRIGLILVAHGHRVVPVTQHGRQDASPVGQRRSAGHPRRTASMAFAVSGAPSSAGAPTDRTRRQQHRSGVALAVVDKGCVDVDAVAHAQPASQRPEIGDGHIQGAHSCWQCSQPQAPSTPARRVGPADVPAG